MKRAITAVLVISCLCLVTGCAEQQHATGMTGTPSGFWYGLWHGLIMEPAFILKLFFDGIAIYDINNNGSWYDFGYLLGANIALGGTTKVACSCKKKG